MEYTPQQLEKLAVILYQQAQLMKKAEGEAGKSNDSPAPPGDGSDGANPSWLGRLSENISSGVGGVRDWATDNPLKASLAALATLAALGGLGYGGYRLLRGGKGKKRKESL